MSDNYQKEYYLRNREKRLAAAKEYANKNKDNKKEYDKKRRELKGEELRAYDRERQSLPERLALKRNWSRKRKMTLKQATPSWLTEFDLFLIKEIYHLAVIRGKCLQRELHVDHIIPLHGAKVCGLHVPSNLQILEATLNLKKKNNFQIEE